MVQATAKQPGMVIVGAGPVGLVLALRLAQAGRPVVLLEKNAQLQADLRASTFHPPTLEMLATLGLAQPLVDLGLRTRHWQIRMHESGERAEFDLAVLNNDTAYPYRLQVEQSELCRLALQRAQAEPAITLMTGWELQSLSQQTRSVSLEISHAEAGRQTLQADLVIACDGARSTVRQQLAVPFSGETYPETSILATTHFPFQDHLAKLSNVNYIWWREGTFSLLRLPQIWRCSLYADSDETVEQALQPAAIERKLQRIVPRDEPYQVEEIRPYRIHQRILPQYRYGRVVFAGDAAHLNSPSGGMGMNGGIHDAFNLAEKLLLWRGDDDFAPLDHYSRQRQPIAREQILQQADRNRRRMQERDPQKRLAELRRLQAICEQPQAMREYLLKSSMIAGLARAATIA